MREMEFVNNPFLGMDSASWPDKNSDGLEKSGETQAEKDRQLFLKSLDNMKTPEKSEKSARGFLLADHGIKLSVKKKSEAAEVKDKDGKRAPGPTASLKKPKEEKASRPGEEDDAEAFLWAMRNAAPLKRGGRSVTPVRGNTEARQAQDPQFVDLLEENLEFALLNRDEYIEGYVTGLDANVLNRLRAGQFGPEAHLDLHGLNSMQAFEAVRDFIRASWFKGLRNVLIVPGRGLNSPNGRSILRQKLQQWLPHDPFKRVVLAFCTAMPHDGGPGSIYVLLRNYRKKGRVYWERLPPDPDLYM